MKINPISVYLLTSMKDGFHYVGKTNDADKRLQQHNRGDTQSTASHRPFQMHVLRVCETNLEARKAEKYFKSGFGRKQIKKMLENLTKSAIIPVRSEEKINAGT